MRLFAISDLHLASAPNRAGLEALPAHPDDWLIVAGGVAEKLETLDWALALLASRFARVLWVPGNHELWSIGGREPPEPRGVERYERTVEIARGRAVLTPEDAYADWPGKLPPGVKRLVLAPLFLLYDYSFRPPDVALEDVVAWAEETHNVCSDELLLQSDPYPSRVAWCHARLGSSEARLDEVVSQGASTILINHWPLRRDVVRIPRVPRFTPWCGTVLTEDWHQRFNAYCVVSGHLHTRRTDDRDGVRFEEVSLGYPRQWDQGRGVAAYLRQIL